MPSENRTAFITGAGKNIGRSIALDLAGRGTNVVINGRTDRAACDEVASAVRAKGVRASVVMADVGVAADAAGPVVVIRTAELAPYKAVEQAFEGAGIGLSLVRELVLLHGGEIRAESVSGALVSGYCYFGPVAFARQLYARRNPAACASSSEQNQRSGLARAG